MKTLTLSGKILYAVPFAIFGFGHLANANSMAGMVPSFVPGGVFWVYVTGLAMLAASISIISGKFIKLNSILLAVLLVTFALTIMLPGLGNENAQIKQMSFIGLMKDLSLAGAALFIASAAPQKE